MSRIVTCTDTIFAVATPPGRSAIAIVRISGSRASQAPIIFGAVCPKAGHFQMSRLMVSKKIIDEALILFMKSPRSSTGEDVCEIHCHGSGAVIKMILERLTETTGFRPADPGEFTRRAFMNEKMDILSIEGLADVIDAQTAAQLHQAWAQVDGVLRGPVTSWRENLITIESQLEAIIDFADEDLPQSVERNLRDQTEKLIREISEILNAQKAGELIRDGVVVALVGPVNAGKSTILNCLTGRSAAIVSDQAGTTRDIVAVNLEIEGVPTLILDTAGVRNSKKTIEAEGIRRSIEAAKNANIVVLVVDAASPSWPNDIRRLSKQKIQPDLLVLNKIDKGLIGAAPKNALVISAQSGEDIDRLLIRLGELILPKNISTASGMITRSRHRKALIEAHDSLCLGLQHDFHESPELASEDFRHAANALGRITGGVDVEELLDKIFSSFCIGK